MNGVVLGTGANIGSNALEKRYIDPNVGLLDNTGEAALSGGLGGAMGGLAHAGQEAAARGLKNRYFNGEEPPLPKSPQARDLPPEARRVMALLAERRGLGPVVGEAAKPVIEKVAGKGKEAVGSAARRGQEFVDGVQGDLRALAEMAQGGGPSFGLAGVGEAPFGRTASGRPRVGLGGFVGDENSLQMAGKGGGKGDGLARDPDGTLSLEGDVGNSSVPSSKTPDELPPQGASQNRKLNAEEYLGPYLEKVKQIYAADPVYLPDSAATEFKVVSGAELSQTRKTYQSSGLRGHHRHPIAHGGPAIPTEPGGLVFTGESQISTKQLSGLDLSFYGELYGKPGAKILKIHQEEPGGVFRFGPNPRHTRVTSLWNEIERWQRKSGVRK